MGMLNSGENQSEGDNKIQSHAYRLVSNRTERGGE